MSFFSVSEVGIKMCFMFRNAVWVNVYVHMSVAGDDKRLQVYQMCACVDGCLTVGI